MDRKEKIRLFGQAIIQDSYDSTSDLQIYKSGFDSTLNLNYKNNLTTCTSLLNTSENPNYTETTVNIPNDNVYISEIFDWFSEYTEEDFYFEFHMKKNTFSMLLKAIKENYLIKIYEQTNYSLPIEKSILITLWYLAKGVSFDDISEKCDIISSYILPLLNSILSIFTNMKIKYVIWPNKKQLYVSSRTYTETYQYPNVIGALGHMHINFKPPLNNDEIYRNKNMGYSLVLQGICNANKEFIDIFPGYPGSMDAATILKHSILYKKIEETSASCFFYNKYHLVASELYPLRSWIMTPFQSNQIDTAQHEMHNNALLSCVSTIDNAFALLQNRWRILKFINNNSTDYIKKIMTACCVLHNFCIKHDDSFDDMLNNDSSSKMNLKFCDYTEEGIYKRNKHLRLFSNENDII